VDGPDASTGSGSRRGPRAGISRPSWTGRSRTSSRTAGTRYATGVPRWVTSIDSPALTRPGSGWRVGAAPGLRCAPRKDRSHLSCGSGPSASARSSPPSANRDLRRATVTSSGTGVEVCGPPGGRRGQLVTDGAHGRACPLAVPPSPGATTYSSGCAAHCRPLHSGASHSRVRQPGGRDRVGCRGHAMMPVGCRLLLPSALRLPPFRRTGI
jgi:hypothetical protein